MKRSVKDIYSVWPQWEWDQRSSMISWVHLQGPNRRVRFKQRTRGVHDQAVLVRGRPLISSLSTLLSCKVVWEIVITVGNLFLVQTPPIVGTLLQYFVISGIHCFTTETTQAHCLLRIFFLLSRWLHVCNLHSLPSACHIASPVPPPKTFTLHFHVSKLYTIHTHTWDRPACVVFCLVSFLKSNALLFTHIVANYKISPLFKAEQCSIVSCYIITWYFVFAYNVFRLVLECSILSGPEGTV